LARLVLISDIHANLPAFEAILIELESINYDEIICLGDVVGYGPHPSECINIIQSMGIKCVKGNHDAGVTGELTERHFRNPNRKLIQITKNLLSANDIDWLKNLPLTIESKDDSYMAVHASPIQPKNWEYLESAIRIRSILKDFNYRFCFVGHTHIQAFVSNQFGGKVICNDGKYLINPGSIGQSRDRDYRASYCVLDTVQNEYNFHRVDYNLENVVNDLEMMGFNRKDAEHLMRIST